MTVKGMPLSADEMSCSISTCLCRFTVLGASSSGRLQLLDLQHQEHPHMRTLPLLPPARPVRMCLHPSKPMLNVACHGPDGIWELRCIHAVTGKLCGISKPSLVRRLGNNSCTVFVLSGKQG